MVAVDPDCIEYGCTHPHVGLDEWALMWMRGLEPREIARHCGVDSWRVNQAIAVRVRRDPTMPARRLKRHLHPLPATLTQRQDFGQKMADYRDWLQRNGREPRENSGSRYERELYGWLARQRAAERRGNLSADRAAALDGVSRWRRPALGALRDEHFAERLEQLAAFVDQQHRIPTRYGGAGEEERRLAVWLMGLRAASRRSWLTAHRVEALDAVAPDWRGRRSPRLPQE
ncbi:helicase associated domain-containing protein [Tersicoccus sp. MR15.9]|uniref:helicase associated domain-containing protein n=1 Tax=Tersicoccus mangrovi TaxID=3121635 RepID=UPI002FE52BEF